LASIQDTIRRHGMLAGGETVVVAVSGGADSVALLHLLSCLSPEWRLALHAVHVDHQLRCDSSRDGEMVRRLGAQLRIPVEVVAVTVVPGACARLPRGSLDTALEACADRLGAQRCRGHGRDQPRRCSCGFSRDRVRGLGIPPTRGRIVRPSSPSAAMRPLLLVAAGSRIEDPNDDRAFSATGSDDLPPALRAYNPESPRPDPPGWAGSSTARWSAWRRVNSEVGARGSAEWSCRSPSCGPAR
jgi:tRNA(Ile)-lysidine synthase